MKRQSLDTIPPTAPAKLAHIVLRSADVPKARAWYMTVLNARDLMEGAEDAAALTYDAEHHRVLILGMSPAERAAAQEIDFFASIDARRKYPGLEHFAFTFNTLGELLATYRRLAKASITPVFCVNHGGTLSLYYLDPDGNNVELLLDTMTLDQSIDFMQNGAFRENAVGYPFDPEDFCRRYEADEPLKALLQSGWEGKI
jgi:catechol-2,3-dioxygenase